MTTQWGAPLTGAQMKLLRPAGLPDEPVRDCDGSLISAGNRSFNKRHAPYSLPADHPAYTLLEAGWLDGRNVALWFGGDEAPDDWDGGDIMRRDGFTGGGVDWKHDGDGCDIIAYIRKDDVRETPTNDHQGGLVLADDCQTVTIAKMTEAEARQFATRIGGRDDRMYVYEVLSELGLIKPEPTREERFWSTQPNGGAHVADDVKAWVREALNFERND